ncbi:lysophospholipid acyltransferase family protein [Paracoccaceae bacterium Fryx2]|nr:lysophospholipid acyltransferase family protein [Paracoccaceae bacterium Fryx2]
MRYALQWIRSLVFQIQLYIVMFFMTVGYALPALIWPAASLGWMQHFGRYARWSAGWMVGLRTEVRGPLPTGGVLIASKHQSFLDSITLVAILDTPRFVMKNQLAKVPIMGWHALRAGFVAVDRGKRGSAIKKMTADVAAGAQTPGQLIIYPQGTRVAPGVQLPYKLGTAVLYHQLGQTCIPVATNVGAFWPRRGIYRKPGVAVVEFLPPIPPGLPGHEFMTELERRIETASDRLLAEAGWKG